MSRPEILAPAGNREMLGAAVFSGAMHIEIRSGVLIPSDFLAGQRHLGFGKPRRRHWGREKQWCPVWPDHGENLR